MKATRRCGYPTGGHSTCRNKVKVGRCRWHRSDGDENHNSTEELVARLKDWRSAFESRRFRGDMRGAIDTIEKLRNALEEVVDHPMVQHYVDDDVRRRWEALVPEEK